MSIERRLPWLLLAAVCMGIGFWAGAAGVGHDVRARRIVVTDELGRDRIVMEASSEKGTSIRFLDSTKQPIIGIADCDDTRGFTCRTPQSGQCAYLGIDTDDGAIVWTIDSKGNCCWQSPPAR